MLVELAESGSSRAGAAVGCGSEPSSSCRAASSSSACQLDVIVRVCVVTPASTWYSSSAAATIA